MMKLLKKSKKILIISGLCLIFMIAGLIFINQQNIVYHEKIGDVSVTIRRKELHWRGGLYHIRIADGLHVYTNQDFVFHQDGSFSPAHNIKIQQDQKALTVIVDSPDMNEKRFSAYFGTDKG
ncbi:MAG: hypothetical protein K2H82_02965 [Oscillospiraceae bacterium]|nr:hypothetical protein [Oscillospiraceae bacterium]